MSIEVFMLQTTRENVSSIKTQTTNKKILRFINIRLINSLHNFICVG